MASTIPITRKYPMNACQFEIEVATATIIKSNPAAIFKWAGYE
jgi:hypothetical protein